MASAKVFKMKYWQSSLLISAMLLSIVPCQSDAQKPSPIVLNPQTCGDFLTRWGDKPAVLKFVRCEQVKNPQIDRLVSSYLVTGVEAAAVEKLSRKNLAWLHSDSFVVVGNPALFRVNRSLGMDIM